MKNKKSNVFVTEFGMLAHLLSDGYYYGIVGVKTKSENKNNEEMIFKYGK